MLVESDVHILLEYGFIEAMWELVGVELQQLLNQCSSWLTFLDFVAEEREGWVGMGGDLLCFVEETL